MGAERAAAEPWASWVGADLRAPLRGQKFEQLVNDSLRLFVLKKVFRVGQLNHFGAWEIALPEAEFGFTHHDVLFGPDDQCRAC